MATMTAPLPTSSSGLRHMEQQLLKEGKTEANQSVNKAEKHNEKLSKQEAKAADALNKAEHRHDTAVADLTNSDREVKLKHQQDAKIQAELEAKKAQAEKLVTSQKVHDDARQARLQEVKDAMTEAH
ncbi:hypothetical protein MSAN_01412400 [Mycena sanguinolenta]|uniref:Uncharacterized protein n=1 Tax=Mycena sanguinolenta TaxID=230812 RepID=A0A8H7D0I7_9AGAR|nr:hypothetical protein MSAN_01412400 [Mycena sanguinolenta]